MSKKVIITQPLHKDGVAILEAEQIEVGVSNTGEPEGYLPYIQDADGLIIRIGHIDRATMEKCPNLKVIGRPGVGVDNVDVKAATELGIPVVIAPRANSRSVAECAFTMMFAAAKDLVRADKETRKGNFKVRSEYKAYEIGGKTLGLIGYGNIGSILAQMSSAVGMSIIVYDPFVKAETVEKLGYRYVTDITPILKEADVISLHVPLTDSTRNLIAKPQLEMMKKNAILVNCARGGIINEKDLFDALTNNVIQAACLDVFEKEPVPADDPLLSLDNVIAYPHMAGQTKEAASNVATGAARGVAAILRGEKWPHVCNPEVYNHPRWADK